MTAAPPSNGSVAAYTAEHGGGTFDALNARPFTWPEGYAVAIGGLTLDPASIDGGWLGWLGQHVAGEYGAPFFGTWLNDGALHVDAVMYISDRERAFAVARMAGQQAVFNFSTKQSEDV